VALRDIAAFQEWIQTELPSRTARRTARLFVAELGDHPWRAPSVPIAELSDQPHYEVRFAALEVAGETDVHVWYRHEYATGDVDLIAITNR
jgi:hypothetical protein